MPSFRESSQPRDQTRISYVSCIGKQVLGKATRETQAKQVGQRLLLSREFPCSWLWEYPQLKAPAGAAAKGSDWNRVFMQV